MFTDRSIKALKPRSKPYREWEGASDRGFNIQVTPKGVKTFCLYYKYDGKRRFLNLGRYPDISLSNARSKLRDARDQLGHDQDPQEIIKQARDARELAKQKRREEELKGTVAQLFDFHCSQMKKDGKKSHKETRRILEKDALPVLGAETKAKDIKPHDIKLALHKVIKRGSMIQANRLRSAMSAAYNYGIEYDNHPSNIKANTLFFIETNPVRDVPKPQKKENPGDTVLNEKEIKKLWKLLDSSELSVEIQTAVKLIIATGGQRVTEVLGACWEEFNMRKKLWELPPGRTKNGKAHIVPLTKQAIDLLRELKPINGRGKYLFPKQSSAKSEEPMPVASISKAISRLCKQAEFTTFTPRDLRRTCKTLMAEMGIPKDIRDRIHNHALTDVASVHYDRYDYLKEKKQLMDLWQSNLQRILTGKQPNNVVRLSR